MKWVTYFPKLSNVHLTKDLGLIPLYMQQVCGYRSLLVGQFPDFDRAGIDDEASKLQLEILDDGGSISFIDRAFISFIRKHARSIQVLNLFQLNRDNLVYGLAYTYFNHTGILYLKLDADNRNFLNRKVHSSSWAKRRILGALEKRFFKVVHVVSVENKRGFNLISRAYPELADKLIYLPNGCNDLFLKKHFQAPFVKSNTVLSVGSPGSVVKNYELFLEALPYLTRFPDWNYRIAGPISAEFAMEWERVKINFPGITSRVEWLGEIKDRLALYREFERAKVFFLCSRSESFGLVYAEALYFGCVLVGHKDMSAYDDLSEQGKFGTYFQDNRAISLVQAIEEAIEKSNNPGIQEAIQTHSAENFSWSTIATTLNSALNER